MTGEDMQWACEGDVVVIGEAGQDEERGEERRLRYHMVACWLWKKALVEINMAKMWMLCFLP